MVSKCTKKQYFIGEKCCSLIKIIVIKGNPEPSSHQARCHRAIALIKPIFNEEKGKVGSHRIVIIMNNKGHSIGRFRVRSIMREQGLNCRIRKVYKSVII